MNAGVVFIFELLRDKNIRVADFPAFDFLNRTADAVFRLGQDELCAKRLDDLLPFLAHVLRHDNHNAVAFLDTDQSDPDASVA